MNTETRCIGPCIVPIEAPMEKIWFTFEYDPAMVEAALHPPDSGQEQPFGAEKVLRRGYPTMSGLVDPEIVLVSKGKISHFVTLCITNFKGFSR